MPTIKSGRPKRDSAARPSVFLNLPYDASSETLFVAYVAGVSALGMSARATLEIPGSTRRLERILGLIGSCPYSVHDLSRVQLDRKAPATPRFNMPFELGMAVAHEYFGVSHKWFVFESMQHRIVKSLSDLNGTDVYIHGGTINGVLTQLGNAFMRKAPQPTIAQMRAVYRELRSSVPQVLKDTGSKTVFEARPFQSLSTLAVGLADRILLREVVELNDHG